MPMPLMAAESATAASVEGSHHDSSALEGDLRSKKLDVVQESSKRKVLNLGQFSLISYPKPHSFDRVDFPESVIQHSAAYTEHKNAMNVLSFLLSRATMFMVEKFLCVPHARTHAGARTRSCLPFTHLCTHARTCACTHLRTLHVQAQTHAHVCFVLLLCVAAATSTPASAPTSVV